MLFRPPSVEFPDTELGLSDLCCLRISEILLGGLSRSSRLLLVTSNEVLSSGSMELILMKFVFTGVFSLSMSSPTAFVQISCFSLNLFNFIAFTFSLCLFVQSQNYDSVTI